MSYETTYIGGYVGGAGGGKSVSLAAVNIWEMLKGRRVWSNMKVSTSKAMITRGLFFGKKVKFKETEPIDWDLLYILDESFIDGTVSIDEIGYFADSRQSGSVKNRLINACIRQVRHRGLNFFYTALDFNMVDYRLRTETDFIVTCEDISFKPWGKENKVEPGKLILQRYYDISGKMTGKRQDFFSKDRQAYRVRRFYATPYWYCYDTREIISLEEAFTGVELDLQKRKISNRDSYTDEKGEAIIEALIELKQAGYDRITSDELWDYLETKGIEGNPSILGRYIPKGLKRRGSNERFIDLNRF